jgi:S1-C subfamily serine protease
MRESDTSDPDMEPDEQPAPSAPAHVPGGLWRKRSVKVAASAAAVLLAAGIAVGVTSALHKSVPADALIPAAPAKNSAFVEDDNGAGQDQQDSILQSSAQGVVSIRTEQGATLGSGFVITRSGYVLSSYHGLTSGGKLTARLAMSGKTYQATLVGADPRANLALLQLSGGTTFSPVTLGTAADVSLNDRVASGGGTWTTKGLTLSTGSITGIDMPVTVDGKKLTGLLQVTSLDVPASELGGPLFNLSGQVLGINVAAGTSQGTGAGYVVPIDSALQLARQLAHQ